MQNKLKKHCSRMVEAIKSTNGTFYEMQQFLKISSLELRKMLQEAYHERGDIFLDILPNGAYRWSV
jgi:hypothetical protein